MADLLGWLTPIGDFLVEYGPWGVAIFEGIFIWVMMKRHREDRLKAEDRRLEEREGVIKTFAEYHKQLLALANQFAKLNAKSTGAISAASAEIRDTHAGVSSQRRAIEQLLMLYTAGVLKIKKPTTATIKSISDFLVRDEDYDGEIDDE